MKQQSWFKKYWKGMLIGGIVGLIAMITPLAFAFSFIIPILKLFRLELTKMGIFAIIPFFITGALIGLLIQFIIRKIRNK